MNVSKQIVQGIPTISVAVFGMLLAAQTAAQVPWQLPADDSGVVEPYMPWIPARQANSDPEPQAAVQAQQSGDDVALRPRAVLNKLALSKRSNQEISVMLQAWPTLTAAERRDLLAEVRQRMRVADNAISGKGAPARDIQVRVKRAQTNHRYGAVQSRSNSRPLVIRTQVTRVLSNGQRVTTRRTLAPSSLVDQAALAQLQIQQARAANGYDPTSIPANVMVRDPHGFPGVRATVRFGAGFENRLAESQGKTRLASTADLRAKRLSSLANLPVVRISTPDGEQILLPQSIRHVVQRPSQVDSDAVAELAESSDQTVSDTVEGRADDE